MEIQFVHNLPSDVPGKTWKEKNLEMIHKIPIGALVEITYGGAPNKGVRLIVCEHTRDCDGTPLYALTWDYDYYERFKDLPYARVSTGGYSDNSVTVIRETQND